MEFTLFNASCKAKRIVLNGEMQANYTGMTAAWFSSPGPWHLNTTQRYRQFWQMGWFTYFIP